MSSETPRTPFWYILEITYRWRRFIISATGIAAIASVIISLLLPKWYFASTSVIAPESSGPNLTALLGDISSAAAALVGGGATGDYIRYMAILNSRSLLEKVVKEFDLIDEYGLQESETPLEDAIEQLREENLSIEVDEKYEYLKIGTYARTPEKAAHIANYLAEALNQRYNELHVENARRFRTYVEQRYQETNHTLDSLREVLQRFQEQYGIIELPTQTQTFLTQLATLKAELARAEIEYEALKLQYGSQNPQVQAAQTYLQASRKKIKAFLAGQDVLLPVPFKKLPEVARKYAEIMQEVLIHSEILKAVRPMLEQASFQEHQQTVAVQVLDPAVPPIKKARPRRMIIVFLTTLSVLLASFFLALAIETWRERAPHIQKRLQKITDASSS